MKLCPVQGESTRVAASATRFCQRLGLAGLLIFSFFAWLSTAAANVGLLMVLLAFLFDARNAWSRLKREPLFLLASVVLTYLAARTAFGVYEFPGLASEQLANGAAFFLLWLLIIPVAWSIEAKTRRIYWVLGLATAGLVLEMLLSVNWNNIARTAFTYKPFDLGVPGIGVGLYSGTMLLGLLLFTPTFWREKTNGLRFWLRATLWITLFFILFQSIIIDSSRGAWLSCALVFPVMILLRIRAFRAEGKRVNRKAIVAGGVLAALLLAPIVWRDLPVIQQRLALEHDVVGAVLTLDIENVPHTSIGQRFHLNVYAMQKWLERPLLGWGAGLSHHLIAQHPLQEVGRHGYPHVHNTYLDILLELGFIGALLFLTGLVLILRALWQSHRRGEISYDLFLFVAGAWAMVLIWNLSNVRMDHVDGRFFLLIISACGYTFHLFRRDGLDAVAPPRRA